MLQIKSITLLLLLALSAYSTPSTAQEGTDAKTCSVLVYKFTDDGTLVNGNTATYVWKMGKDGATPTVVPTASTYTYNNFVTGTTSESYLIVQPNTLTAGAYVFSCSVTYLQGSGASVGTAVSDQASNSLTLVAGTCTQPDILVTQSSATELTFAAASSAQGDVITQLGQDVPAPTASSTLTITSKTNPLYVILKAAGSDVNQSLIVISNPSTYLFAETNKTNTTNNCEVQVFQYSVPKETNYSTNDLTVVVNNGAVVSTGIEYFALVDATNVTVYVILDVGSLGFGKTVSITVTIKQKSATPSTLSLRSKAFSTTTAAATGSETDCTAKPKLTLTQTYNDACTGVNISSSSDVSTNAFSSLITTLSGTLTGKTANDLTALLDTKTIILSKDGTSQGYLIVDTLSTVCAKGKQLTGTKSCEAATFTCLREASSETVGYAWSSTPVISGFIFTNNVATANGVQTLTIPKDVLTASTAYTFKCQTSINGNADPAPVTYTAYTPVNTGCDSGNGGNGGDSGADNSQILSILVIALLALLI